MTCRNVFTGFVVFGMQLALGGCFWGSEVAFVQSEDVRMEPVTDMSMRASEEYGDVYTLSLQTAHEVNGWIGEAIDGAGEVVDALTGYPPSSKDGAWAVYGPYDDNEGRAWLIRLDGDESGSLFEAYVGPEDAEEAAEMDRLLWGSIEVGDERRLGEFSLDFDVIETWEIKSGPDVDRHYTGRVEVVFDRDLTTEEKHVDLTYTDFEVTQEVPVPDYFSADHYGYHRAADGSGRFDLSIVGTFQTLLWSGPERERMTLDLIWNEAGEGRGLGTVRNWEDEGDLAHGALQIEECFDGQGLLVWRDLSDGYDGAFPAYDMGDPEQCVYGPDALQ